jgi:hypothetical protein
MNGKRVTMSILLTAEKFKVASTTLNQLVFAEGAVESSVGGKKEDRQRLDNRLRHLDPHMRTHRDL